MSIDSGSSRAAVKIGVAIPATVASISASRIRPAARAGNAHATRHAAAASTVLQPLLTPKASRIRRVRPHDRRGLPWPGQRSGGPRFRPPTSSIPWPEALVFKPSRTQSLLPVLPNPAAPPSLPLRPALMVGLGLRLLDANIGQD